MRLQRETPGKACFFWGRQVETEGEGLLSTCGAGGHKETYRVYERSPRRPRSLELGGQAQTAPGGSHVVYQGHESTHREAVGAFPDGLSEVLSQRKESHTGARYGDRKDPHKLCSTGLR